MSIPALILGFVIASLYGALYHLMRDGGIWRLMFYLVLAWAGFTTGHFVGAWLGWEFFPLGLLNLGTATLGSLVFLGAGDWLSHIERPRKSKV